MVKKTILPVNGAMNQDVSPLSLDAKGGAVLERRNARVASNRGGRVGANVPLKGMQLITGYLPLVGDNKVIGYVEDVKRGAGIFFVHNSAGNHCIFSLDSVSKVVSNVVFEQSILNFNLEYPITHVNVVGDLLYWVDGLNPPRKINILKAKAYTGEIEVGYFIDDDGDVFTDDNGDRFLT